MLYDSSYRRVATVRAGNGYAGRPARDPPHPGGHGVDRRVRSDPHEPVRRARRRRRRPHRLGRAGDRRQDRARDVGVARARAHSDRRIEQPGVARQLPVGLRARQLGRPRARRATCCCRRATRWTLYDVDIHSGGFIWRLGGSRSSFKLAPGARFYWQHDAEFQPGGLISAVRQRLGSAEGEAVARAAAGARPGQPHGQPRQAVRQPAKTLLAESQGNAAGAARRQTGCSATAGCRTSPSSTPPAASCSTGRSAANVQDFTTFLSPWSGQPDDAAVARRGAAAARGRSRSPRAGTARPTSRPGACSPAPRPSALAPVATRREAGFETTITAPRRRALPRRAGARRRRRRDRRLSGDSGPDGSARRRARRRRPDASVPPRVRRAACAAAAAPLAARRAVEK